MFWLMNSLLFLIIIFEKYCFEKLQEQKDGIYWFKIPQKQQTLLEK